MTIVKKNYVSLLQSNKILCLGYYYQIFPSYFIKFYHL